MHQSVYTLLHSTGDQRSENTSDDTLTLHITSVRVGRGEAKNKILGNCIGKTQDCFYFDKFRKRCQNMTLEIRKHLITFDV